MRPNRFAAGCLLLLVGCSLGADGVDDDDAGAADPLTVENFGERVANAQCSIYENCDLLEYFGGTFDSCLDFFQPGWSRCAVECDFERALASECLGEWTAATCDSIQETAIDSACDELCDCL